MNGDKTQLTQHLLELADSLEGEGWSNVFFLEEMTPAQRLTYKSASEAERLAWLFRQMDEPIEIVFDNDGDQIEHRHNGTLIWRREGLAS